jgi:hypothetical protein
LPNHTLSIAKLQGFDMQCQGFSKVVAASEAKQSPSCQGDCRGAKNAPRNDESRKVSSVSTDDGKALYAISLQRHMERIRRPPILTIHGTSIIINAARGDVAQLGERFNRTEEVVGSNPIVSTTTLLLDDC